MVNFSEAYTEAKAQAKRDAYRHLIGSTYYTDQSDWGVIQDIAIAPYESLNRYIFAWFYTHYNDAVRAINFYTAPYFDVYIIALSADGKSYGFRKLDSYLEGQVIPMDVVLSKDIKN